MPAIIAITDFSKIADNAITYSCDLATATGAGLSVIHSFVFPVMFSDVQIPATLVNDTQRDAEQKMAVLIGELQSRFPTLAIDGTVVYGDIVDTIEDRINNDQAPWLVIAGNSNTDENSAWFESTLKDAGHRLKVPLLAVPPQATYNGIAQIAFAYDNHPVGSDIALVQLRELVFALNARLHVFNAQADVLNSDNAVQVDAHVQEVLAPASPEYHFEYGKEVNEAIINFNEERNIDWLAIIPHQHSFFEGLFHRSHTKAIAQHSMIPILMLHEVKEG